jgi:pimeloyl-ACP methyl ester carboxylesterase
VWIQSARMQPLPDRLDDAALLALLGAGRPEGEPGSLTVDGAACPLLRAGAGRPMLFVHGLGHDAWDWSPLWQSFVQRNTCVALDLPGFGLADKPATVTLQTLVRALFVAAEVCGAPPVVVASSLGGHVALLAALEAPQRFAGLVLLATGGLVVVPEALQAQLRHYYSVDAIYGRSEAEIVGNSRRIFFNSAHPLSDALARRKLAVHRSSMRTAFARPFASVVDDVFRWPVRDRMNALKVPALFLSGAGDVVVPPDACRAGAAASGNRFILLDDVGHCPHLEAPERTARHIEEFLAAEVA